MFKPVLYAEQTAIPLPRKFLTEGAYADALEAFVLVCTDCVFVNTNRQTFYLAKRKSKPMSDWWFIGGRSFAGEYEGDSMCRSLKRETGLDIDPDRLKFVTMKRYVFKDRQQFPQDKGCDSLCYIFALQVTDEEIAIANAHLDSDEYDVEDGLREFGKAELESTAVFSPIVDLYEHIFDASIAKPGDEWIVLHSSADKVEDCFTWCQARTKRNVECGFQRLGDKLPASAKQLFVDAFNRYHSWRRRFMRRNKRSSPFDLQDVQFWSDVSCHLGIALHMCHQDSRGFAITRYYAVYPDKTVQHVSMIDQSLGAPRRPVQENERREFFVPIKTGEWSIHNEPVSLPGADV